VDSINISNHDVLWCTNKRRIMKEIDQMLKQWIHNSIIRAKLRELIVKECFKSFDLGVEDGDHKLNTITKR